MKNKKLSKSFLFFSLFLIYDLLLLELLFVKNTLEPPAPGFPLPAPSPPPLAQFSTHPFFAEKSAVAARLVELLLLLNASSNSIFFASIDKNQRFNFVFDSDSEKHFCSKGFRRNCPKSEIGKFLKKLLKVSYLIEV